jgi:hypothetical protein
MEEGAFGEVESRCYIYSKDLDTFKRVERPFQSPNPPVERIFLSVLDLQVIDI